MRDVESDGGEITTVEEIDGLVGVEFMEEQVQMVREIKKKKRGTSFSRIGPIWRNQCGAMSVGAEGKPRCEPTNGIIHFLKSKKPDKSRSYVK